MVRSPLPTTVLGGFLGAGKTTLVNHLLRNAEGRRITVLVNDFGELAIDLDLIEARDGAKLSLANGCACCSTGGDLARALNQLLDAPERPDRLLIEASGVADPARLADLARADPDLVLAGIVVVADRGRIVDLVSDPRIGAQVARQLAAADLVILNKQDLPAPQELEGLLHRLAPQAAVVRATEAVVPVDLILGELSPRGAWWAEAASNIDHEGTYDRWAIVGGAAVSLDDLRSRLAALPAGILRLKGFVPLQDGRTAIVQASTGQQKIVVAPPRPLLAMRLVAIGVRGLFAPAELDRLFAR